MTRLSLLPSMLAAALAAAAFGQAADAYVPNSDPTTGVAANSIPFNPNFGTTPGDFTHLIVVPAARLTTAGIPTGSALYDLKLAPTGTGTLTFPSFKAIVGHLKAAPNTTDFLTQFLDKTNLYDSDVQGPFTWSLTGNAWSSLGLGGAGFVWDGVHDVGVYTTHSGLSLTTSTGWNGTFWREGVTTRQYAAGYQTQSYAVQSTSALKVDLTFLTGPDAAASAMAYGRATGGQFGPPIINAIGLPQFGNTTFAVTLASAAANATAIFAVSLTAADVQCGATGQDFGLEIDPTVGVFQGILIATTDSNGCATISAPIGAFDAAQVGVKVDVQWIVLDPAGPATTFGVNASASGGLALTIGV